MRNEVFANLEKHPLTEKQYLACTSESATTLVLAGAGTGKTSTLLGRIAYLYEVHQLDLTHILALAFAVEAAQEVQQRVEQSLSGQYGITRNKLEKFKSRTFHSLGLYIVEQVEGKRPQLTSLIDEGTLRIFLRQQFEVLSRSDIRYRQWIYHYFSYVEDTREHYPKRTLNDDYVENQAELCLANFFYLMGISYIYKAHYAPDYYMQGMPYRCSFYLPDSRTYIDIWDKGLSEHVRQQYKAIHQSYGTRCLFYEKDVKLAEHLFAFPLDRDIVRSSGRVDQLLDGLLSLLLYFKSQGIDSRQLAQQPAPESDCFGRMFPEALIQLLLPLYQAYERHLQVQGEIDFDGMIVRATNYINQGAFVVPWTDVLIDEFQDISLIRLQLIQAIQQQRESIRLFLVGDDWQTIYQFAGSRLGYIRDIENYFGATSIIALDQTFRFHQGLCDISSRFIQKNPQQYRKKLSALKSSEESLVLVALPAELSNQLPNEKLISRIVKDIQGKAHTARQVSCLLLARFNHQLPSDTQLCQWQSCYPDITIKAMSIHASKGMEADYVIVLNLNAGEYGLPSEKIECYQPIQQEETYPHASERRVLYVAITRAKERVYLCYDDDNPSCFVKELQEEIPLRQLGQRDLITSARQGVMALLQGMRRLIFDRKV